MDLNIYTSSSSSDEEELLDYIALVPDQRTFQRRSNPMEIFSDVDFIRRYRLSKVMVHNLLHTIGNNIAPTTARGQSLSPLLQILVALKFLASGSFYITIGDNAGIRKSTVSRVVKKVVTAIAALSQEQINMPQGPEDIALVKQQFLEKYQFPDVIGCVDGTHIKVQSPGGDDAERYRNRKGYFSYNVQVVCDANLKIRSIDARWPGSTHDSTIFNASYLRIQMEENYPTCYLLGDSAYPCRNYLMTPILNPQNEGEEQYNKCQIRARNTVERCFGVWKRRFPALSFGYRTAKETTLSSIVACAVLHNIAIDSNEVYLDGELAIDLGEIQDPHGHVEGEGNAERRRLINAHFL